MDNLIKRLEEAEGADRELDAAIALNIGLIEPYEEGEPPYGLLQGYRQRKEGGDSYPWDASWWDYHNRRDKPDFSEVADRLAVPEWTASLGAALALVKEVFPGCRTGIRDHEEIEGDGAHVWIKSNDYHVVCWTAGGEATEDTLSGWLVRADHKSPAIALLIALLKAHAVEVE